MMKIVDCLWSLYIDDGHGNSLSSSFPEMLQANVLFDFILAGYFRLFIIMQKIKMPSFQYFIQ